MLDFAPFRERGVGAARFELRYEVLVCLVFGPGGKDCPRRGKEADLLGVVVEALVVGQEEE